MHPPFFISAASEDQMILRIYSAIGMMAVAFLAAAPTCNVFRSQSWHDQERMIQIVLITLATLSLVLTGAKARSSINPKTIALCATICLLATASSALSHQPLWAFTEVSLFIGCVCLGIACVVLRQHFQEKFDSALILAMTLAICGICLKFLASYIASQVFHARLEPVALLDGFNNLRHLGQFQTLSLPLLAFPLLIHTNRKIKAFFFCLMVLWWVTTITAGTRACFMAMAGAIGFMLLMGPQARQWCWLQLVSFGVAVGIFCLMMYALPSMLGNPPLLIDDRFFSTTLSMRDILWKMAIEVIRSNPWLGIGPMHYADQTSIHVAHPHNALLQWAAEWGLPSLMLVLTLLAPLITRMISSVYRSRLEKSYVSALRVCLTGALIAIAAQAMVDGVIVMPYTQTWLAISMGWLLSLEPASPVQAATRISHMTKIFGLVVAIMACSVLIHIAVRDYQTLAALNIPDQPPRLGKGTDPPRFWLQGSIANPELPGSYGYKPPTPAE